MKRRGIAQKGILFASIVALVLAGLGLPVPALAEDQPASDLEQLQVETDNLVAKIEETTAAYQEAEAEVESLNEQIAQNEQHSAEVAAKLPEQRERTAASIKNMYIFQQSSSSLLEIVLSSQDFEEFLTTLHYLDIIHERNATEIENLNSMVTDLATTNALLVAERDEAVKKQEAALAALEEARAARAELQAHAISVALSEQGDREQAIATVQAALEATGTGEVTFTTSSGNTATVQVPSSANVSTEPLTTNITSQESGDWAARINEYLKGSPLEGYGETFAAAAAKYGVDPRLSPAIATIESGKGSVCFKDYNAWGWGNSSYSDWESAIYDQVEGLATGYDGTLTLEGAERYCPPNYQEWYSSVANEMDGI